MPRYLGPLVLFLGAFLALPAQADWHAVSPGVDSWVYALGTYNGACVVGGSFGSADDITARSIANFDGSNWFSLQSGIHAGMPLAFAEYQGNLIAAGSFPRAGSTKDDPDGILASKIAQWNGSAWGALGSGVSGADAFSVSALTDYNGRLVAGGVFSSAGGVSAGNIAQWDGTSWSPLAAGMDGPVAALAVYQGRLIAGGSFRHAGGTPVNCIAQWDGTSWSPLGTGVDVGWFGFLDVWALTVYQGQLVAAGIFYQAGGTAAHNIAAWDGAAWHPLGLGLSGGSMIDGAVGALEVYHNRLIAGGIFTTAGGSSAQNIAQWDGQAWSPLGEGTDLGVFALKTTGSGLFAGGAFTRAGEQATVGLARWDSLPAIATGPATPPPPSSGNSGSVSWRLGGNAKFILLTTLSGAAAPVTATAPATPMMVSGGTTIRFRLAQPVPTSLGIFAADGRLVRNLFDQMRGPGEYVVRWDGRDDRGVAQPSGVYLCRLSSIGLRATGKLLLEH